jgi:hypothetical protein
MSDAGGKRIKLWDSLEVYETVPGGRTDAVKAAIKVDLTAFDRHKEDLLTILRNDHERGPKAEPFDPNRSWRGLTSLAGTYLWEGMARKELMPAAEQVARLRELGKVFGKARVMAYKAMQDEVGTALCTSWWEGTSEYAEAGGRFVDLLYINREFEPVVASLATLETAAIRAASNVRTGRGRPKGTAILPQGDIEALADGYRDWTGLKPGAGDGPFARFVCKFLAALGRNIEHETVIDAIKDARTRSLQNPSVGAPSPFDE